MYRIILFFILIFNLCFNACQGDREAILSIDGRKSGSLPYIMKGGHAYIRADKAAEALTLAYGSDISFNRTWDKILVLVDPGHGGHDTGTYFDVRTTRQEHGKEITKSRRMTEKDLNMLYAFEIKKAIETDPRFEVRLTRETDVFLSLPYRSYISKVVAADFFVSVHVNSLGAKRNKECPKSGFEVYSISENALNAIPIEDGKSPKKRKKQMEFLQRNAENSYVLAHFIAERLKEAEIPIYSDKNVFTADFAVLRRSQIPAVLLETGFLCNAEDREKLESDEYREKTAQSVYLGLLDYAEESGYIRNEQ